MVCHFYAAHLPYVASRYFDDSYFWLFHSVKAKFISPQRQAFIFSSPSSEIMQFLILCPNFTTAQRNNNCCLENQCFFVPLGALASLQLIRWKWQKGTKMLHQANYSAVVKVVRNGRFSHDYVRLSAVRSLLLLL